MNGADDPASQHRVVPMLPAAPEFAFSGEQVGQQPAVLQLQRSSEWLGNSWFGGEDGLAQDRQEVGAHWLVTND